MSSTGLSLLCQVTQCSLRREGQSHGVGTLFLSLWKLRLSESGVTKIIVTEPADGWTTAAGSLVPGRGQAVDGDGRLVGAANASRPGGLKGLSLFLHWNHVLLTLKWL